MAEPAIPAPAAGQRSGMRSYLPSPRTQVGIILTLALPQLYLLPAGAVDISLMTIGTLLLVPTVLLKNGFQPFRELLQINLYRILIALLVVRILALAWAPNPRAGAQPIVLLGQFIITLVIITDAVRHDRDLLSILQRVYWPWVLVEAALVVLFRLFPEVENAFLRSIGGLFAGQNTVAALFGDSPNNVLDAAKSGGVFVNANVAAMFLGVNALAAFAFAPTGKTRWGWFVGAVALAAIPFTGSKSAIIFAIALPTAAFGIAQLRRPLPPKLQRYLLITAASVATGLVALLLISTPNLWSALKHAYADRTTIWAYGTGVFSEAPILGLGYGGWEIGFIEYGAAHGFSRAFPPHNIFLASWSTTGMFGLIATMIFFVLLLYSALRLTTRQGGNARGFAAYAGAAFGWVLIHGMGENTDIFGEIHLIPIISMLIVYVVRAAGEESKDSAAESGRRYSAASTVSAIGNVHRQPGSGAP